MSAPTVSGLASVIVPCWNQLEFTRRCIASLYCQTGSNWEFIVIDNGSNDGTSEYLAGVQDVSPVPVTLISNATNRGFPTAINQGLQYARGEYLVLLNNDVVVTDGWLDQLVALTTVTAAEAHELATEPAPAIGLAGPMSNYAAPPQLVESVPYRDLNDMKVFAQRWRDEHRGQWFTVHKLSGFCLLMKRAVFDAIGGLDERFGLGFFDDDDLAERARRAGFELAVAHDLFVQHFGSRTFVGNGIDANRLLDENAAKFAAKWGNSVAQGRRVALRSWNGEGKPAPASVLDAAVPDSDIRLKAVPRGGHGRISLTMIVKDEEKNIASCLKSVKGLFDEIVVLDTGSQDRTVEIARSFGARVFDFVWVDDFAAARNAALARAKGDYAFWLDADDVVDAREREKLDVLLDRLRGTGTGTDIPGRSQPPFPSAYVVRCACDPGPDGSGGETVVDHIRLFPVIEGVRWTYRVHEQILPGLKRAGVPVEWTEITVRHTGYSDRALRSRKLDRDCRILREELVERPDDPFTTFNLGSIAIERADWDEALGYLRHSLSRSAPTDSITRKLFALIGRAHQMKGDFAAALACCAEGLSFDPDDAELLFRKAVVHRHAGEPGEAAGCWRRILTLSRPQKFASMDQGIYGHLTRRNLAALAMERGDTEEALCQWRAVLAECPGDRKGLRQLAIAEAVLAGAQKI